MTEDHSHSILLYHGKVGMFAFSDIQSQRLLELEMISEVNPLDSWGKKDKTQARKKTRPGHVAGQSPLHTAWKASPLAVNAFPKARQHQAWARLNVRVPRSPAFTSSASVYRHI